ncbi:MAG: EthD domain-containing protein [Sphingobium phenoxybenzoativorans]|uniref:EthD domain-containing protein n=1 Tax=Sphingobium phenoxybenzoativorans TaxID=1592790 RepID=A0A975K4M8_9SPHN|nr:EthD domain-containing protein [Sphingobium phenoxybenzoativorans]QUT04309.1 EthD domain-containing protein [Sphingobium phenoxybenzoativorans]
MLKILTFARRRPGMSLEEFDDYWRNHHGPLVSQYLDLIGDVRYVQTRVAHPRVFDMVNGPRNANPGASLPYDGVAEHWFESEEALIAAWQSPAGKEALAAIAADEPNFIDHKTSYNFVGEQRLVYSSPGYKSPLGFG